MGGWGLYNTFSRSTAQHAHSHKNTSLYFVIMLNASKDNPWKYNKQKKDLEVHLHYTERLTMRETRRCIKSSTTTNHVCLTCLTSQ